MATVTYNPSKRTRTTPYAIVALLNSRPPHFTGQEPTEEQKTYRVLPELYAIVNAENAWEAFIAAKRERPELLRDVARWTPENRRLAIIPVHALGPMRPVEEHDREWRDIPTSPDAKLRVYMRDR